MAMPASQASPRSKRPDGNFIAQPTQDVAAADRSPMTVSDEAIARRAYEKFLARGCTHGSDREDWAEASRELLAEAFGK